MRKLDVGSGRRHFEDYETLDCDPIVGADWIFNIEDDNDVANFADSFDYIRAHHILEHIKPENKVLVMSRLHNWLKVGGILDIEVPVAGTQQFWQDPTHLSGWVPETFWYFIKGDRFGEAFAKRYSGVPVPLMEKVSDKLEDWRYNIILRKV